LTNFGDDRNIYLPSTKEQIRLIGIADSLLVDTPGAAGGRDLGAEIVPFSEKFAGPSKVPIRISGLAIAFFSALNEGFD
jgi:hypothetical protein